MIVMNNNEEFNKEIVVPKRVIVDKYGNEIHTDDEHILQMNLNNTVDPHLARFPEGAREEVENKIHTKMYDYYKATFNDTDTLTALEYLGKKFSYGFVNEQIEKYARAFKGYGLQQGDYVSVLLPNMPEIIYVKMALNRVGAVANLIDPRYNPNSARDLINASNSKMVICVLNKYDTAIKPIQNELNVENIFTISPFESISLKEFDLKDGLLKQLLGDGAYFLTETKQLIMDAREKILKNTGVQDINNLLKYGDNYVGNVDTPYVENAPATVLYTSGTTGGKLKGAVHTNEGYNGLHAQLEYVFPEQRPGMVFSGLIPMFLSYGSGVCMFNSLASRFDIKLHPTFKPNEFVKIVEQDQPNIIVGVPKFFQMMKNSGKNFDYVDHIIIGGDKILPKQVKEFKDYFDGTRVAIGYGETELLGVISVTLEDGETLDSSGTPMPNVKVKIVDPETHKELPFMEEGEAYISSVSAMLEYLNNKEQTDKITFYDPETGEKYFATGDLMRMLPNGQLIFEDRLKRLMKRPDGHQVNAGTIEEVISEVNGVKEVCVVGLPYKDIMGVIPTAFVVSDENSNRDDIVNACEQASYDKLTSARDKALAYVFLDEMPYTPNGKMDAFSLSKNNLDDLEDAYIVDYSFIDKKDRIRR